MMKAGFIFLVISLLSVDAVAQEEANWYTTAKLGANILGDQNVTFVGGGITASDKASFDTGFAAGGAIGYDFGNQWRVEGEFMYRTSDLDTTNLAGIGSYSDGNYASTALAINGLYDFNIAIFKVDIDFREKRKTRTGIGAHIF